MNAIRPLAATERERTLIIAGWQKGRHRGGVTFSKRFKIRIGFSFNRRQV
jgi:hypothetical protein